MDFADDVAYSVHDLEDGVVGGRIDLALLDHDEERFATWETVRDWYLPAASDELLDEALGRVRSVASWPVSSYDGSRRGLAALKNLTSDLIGIFCGSVLRATQQHYGDRALVRHQADLVVPAETAQEIAVLKGIAAHYVMRAQDRLDLMERQRTVLHELFEAMWKRGSEALDPALRQDFDEARRRLGAHPGGPRPDRQPDRRVRDHPARPPGPRPRGAPREAGAMTSSGTASGRLVWLPFDPEVLGELPSSLRYEHVDPDDLPDNGDEVELYVRPTASGPRTVTSSPGCPGSGPCRRCRPESSTSRASCPTGVQLCNGRGIHDTSTAELTLALILASLRGIPEFVRAQSRGRVAAGVPGVTGGQAGADRRLRADRRGDRGAGAAVRGERHPGRAQCPGRRTRDRQSCPTCCQMPTWWW